MPTPIFNSEAFIIHLLAIRYKRLIGGVEQSMPPIYIQNGYANNYVWRGKTFNYLPFLVDSINSSNQIDEASATLTLPNVGIIRDAIANYDGLRRGSVVIYSIFPEDDNGAAHREDAFLISSTRFDYAAISISLQSPLNGTQGFIPSRNFSSDVWRELPYRQSRAF